MKPLNTKERDTAFWSFVLFFVLALGLIIGVISLTFMIPQKQITELRNKVGDYDSFKSKQSSIKKQIDTISYSFEHYYDPGMSQTFLQKDITKKNLALADAVGNENETNRLYHKVIDNFKSMLKYKADLDDANKQLLEANSVLRNCQDDLREVEKKKKDLQKN